MSKTTYRRKAILSRIHNALNAFYLLQKIDWEYNIAESLEKILGLALEEIELDGEKTIERALIRHAPSAPLDPISEAVARVVSPLCSVKGSLEVFSELVHGRRGHPEVNLHAIARLSGERRVFRLGFSDHHGRAEEPTRELLARREVQDDLFCAVCPDTNVPIVVPHDLGTDVRVHRLNA